MKTRIWTWALSLLALTLSAPVFASLGGKESTAETDCAKLSGVDEAVINASYTVHTCTTHKSTIKQFVFSTGIVCKVSWTGTKHPDEKLLLGSNASKLNPKLSSNPQSSHRRFLQVVENDLVLKKFGRPRSSMGGEAYIPSCSTDTDMEALQ